MERNKPPRVPDNRNERGNRDEPNFPANIRVWITITFTIIWVAAIIWNAIPGSKYQIPVSVQGLPPSILALIFGFSLIRRDNG